MADNHESFRIRSWARFWKFDGRTRRRDYWLTQLIVNALLSGMGLVTWLASQSVDQERVVRSLPLLMIVPTLILGWVSLTVTVRRLHDLDLAGRWILLPVPFIIAAQISRGGPIGVLPFVATTLVALLSLLDGTAGPNSFGEDPKHRPKHRHAVEDGPTSRFSTLALGFDRTAAIAIGTAAILLLAGSRLLGPVSALIPATLAARVGDASIPAQIPGFWRCSAPGTDRVLTSLAARMAPETAVKVVYTTYPNLSGLALPGGRIIVGQQAVRAARRPEELAGLLAHEVAHGVLRHPERKLLSSAALSLLPGGLVGSYGVVARAWAMPYSRAIERDADAEAARLLAHAGIAPRHLGAMLARLNTDRGARGGRLPAWQSTHPSTRDRTDAIGRFPGPSMERAAMTAADWSTVRRGCEAGTERLAVPRPARDPV